MKTENVNKEYRTIEDRKRYVLRKEMNAAYKKNNQYLNVSKKSIDQWLKNLLEETDDVSQAENILSQDEEESLENSQQEFRMPAVYPYYSWIPFSASVREHLATGEEDVVAPLSSTALPNRFLRDFHLRINRESLFGKNLENQIFRRVYNEAISNYVFQMEMAQNNFRMYEPTFSQIA